jgi:hypothetical protein
MTGSRGGKAARDWEVLSSRQRDILRWVFRADQAAGERERKRQRQRQLDAKALFPQARPASEWRWVNRDAVLGRHRPRAGDPADFAELEARGLIEIDAATAMVQVTRAGRAAVRAGTGSLPQGPPRGLLSRWSWAALARLHAAGAGGLVLDARSLRSVPHWERCPSWSTVVRFRNRRIPYAEELKVNGESCVRLTPAGREHVESNLDRYTAAYPDVPVPGPDSPEALHRGDLEQLRADAGHRRQLHELASASVQARRHGDHAQAARLDAEADELRQPSACGHWLGSGRDQRGVSLGEQAIGAACGQPRPRPGTIVT